MLQGISWQWKWRSGRNKGCLTSSMLGFQNFLLCSKSHDKVYKAGNTFQILTLWPEEYDDGWREGDSCERLRALSTARKRLRTSSCYVTKPTSFSAALVQLLWGDLRDTMDIRLMTTLIIPVISQAPYLILQSRLLQRNLLCHQNKDRFICTSHNSIGTHLNPFCSSSESFTQPTMSLQNPTSS